ncbi:MAG: hypothetical protein ACJA0N_000610 [Pseudohongiellaceae bacterium]|jgi:uncharacterized protein (DUF2062 family)
MPKKIIQRFLPDPEWIKNHKSLQFLGTWLHDSNLWHLNRRCASTAVFIGLFVAFIPLPSQMIFAAFLAVVFRANMPLSVVLVWISNPITMPPMFYMAYKVGVALIGNPEAAEFSFELSWQWLGSELIIIWQPFLLGCLVCGLFFGLLGSAIMRITWRFHVIQLWRERRQNRLARRSKQ